MYIYKLNTVYINHITQISCKAKCRQAKPTS